MSKELECEQCGAEMIYDEEAGVWECPECGNWAGDLGNGEIIWGVEDSPEYAKIKDDLEWWS